MPARGGAPSIPSSKPSASASASRREPSSRPSSTRCSCTARAVLRAPPGLRAIRTTWWAPLVVTLPSRFEGGAFVVQHRGEEEDLQGGGAGPGGSLLAPRFLRRLPPRGEAGHLGIPHHPHVSPPLAGSVEDRELARRLRDRPPGRRASRPTSRRRRKSPSATPVRPRSGRTGSSTCSTTNTRRRASGGATSRTGTGSGSPRCDRWPSASTARSTWPSLTSTRTGRARRTTTAACRYQD